MHVVPPVRSKNRHQEKSAATLLGSDTLVYLVLSALVWFVWQLSKAGLFKAGDDTGYWLGVAGATMLVLLFVYPLRKHLRFARNWGRVKWWFLVHMLLGIGGPLLILLHSTFHIGSLNAGVALWSMVVVALSGVVGRFIYARVNRGLHGELISFQELQVMAKFDREEVRSRLAFAPEIEASLRAFEAQELETSSDWLTHARRVVWLPIQQWQVYRQCLRNLEEPLRKLAAHGNWSARDYARRERTVKRMVRRYLTAVVRVAQYTAYERFFSLWHVAHIPFVYLMVVSAVVHVVAVHAY